MIAQNFKVIQKATIAQAKRASSGKQIARKSKTIKVHDCHILCLKRKEKKKEQIQKKRERKEAGEFSSGSN